MITDFIYKMPERIKDLRNRNEEVSRLIDDSFANQTAAVGSNPFYQHGGNLQGSLYHHTSFGVQQLHGAANKAANLANENHDFEDFLNLVYSLHDFLICFFFKNAYSLIFSNIDR